MLAANEGHAYLFLSLLQARVGGSLMRRLPGGDAACILGRPAPELAREMGLGERAARALVEVADGFDATAVLDRLARNGFGAVTYADEAYPARLRLAPDPPPALFVGGEMGEGPCVAIVGSRRATRSGLETAEVLGQALAARGTCVVSGLAAGVDAAAHEGALAAGGRTVGVLGCGIDVAYPPKYKPPRPALPCPNLRRGPQAGTGECVAIPRSRGYSYFPLRRPSDVGGAPVHHPLACP